METDCVPLRINYEKALKTYGKQLNKTTGCLMKTNSFVNTPLKKQLTDMAYIFLSLIKLDRSQ